MNIPQPITLADAGTQWTLDDTPGHRYVIKIAPGSHVAVCFGADARKPAAKFTHGNLVASPRKIHEFKHSRSSGGKYWTARPGVDHWFIFPKSAVTLLPEKGMSYVLATINGVRVTFNVSGGGGGDGGWVDLVGERVHASVGHGLKDLNRLAEVAVRGTPAETALLAYLAGDSLDAGEEARFGRLVAASSVPPALVAKYRAGEKGLRVALTPGHGADDVGTLSEIVFLPQMTWRKPTPSELLAHPGVARFGSSGNSKRIRWFHVSFESRRLVRVMPKQVDWLRTKELNDLGSC